MNKILPVILIAASVTVVAPIVPAADKEAPRAEPVVLYKYHRAKATIVKVNAKERTLTLRSDQGDEMQLVVSEEVRNFKQIKKGDIVEVEYQAAAASLLEKAQDTNYASQATTLERAPAGSKPGMRAGTTSSIVATVLEVDSKKRLLTVQGPNRKVVTIEVPASLKAFDSLKKGDKISAVVSEAIAVSVKPAPKK